MTFKRRNQGRAKHNRGHTRAIRCSGCGRCTPKDKSICRFQVKNIVESAAQRDIRDACAYESKYSLEIMQPQHYLLSRLSKKMQDYVHAYQDHYFSL